MIIVNNAAINPKHIVSIKKEEFKVENIDGTTESIGTAIHLSDGDVIVTKLKFEDVLKKIRPSDL